MRAFRDTRAIDWADVVCHGKLRIALLVVVAMGWCIATGRPADALSLTFGIVIVAITDVGGACSLRAPATLVGAALMVASVYVGSVVEDHIAVHLVVVAALAFCCGFAAFRGPRAALTGTAILAMFAIYAGFPHASQHAGRSALLFAGGAAGAIIAEMAPWLLRRATGLRVDLARAYRGLAAAARGMDVATVAAIHAQRLRNVSMGVAADGVGDPAAGWFAALVHDGRQIRLGLLALTAERPGVSDPGGPHGARPVHRRLRCGHARDRTCAGVAGLAAGLDTPAGRARPGRRGVCGRGRRAARWARGGPGRSGDARRDAGAGAVAARPG